jgi:predicted RNase H-like HicB family nuclease
MRIPVLIEPVDGSGYRASAGDPLGFTAVGATREQALGKLQELIKGRLARGAELTAIEVKPIERPWAKYAGAWPEDDPLVQEWKQAVEEYRRQRDEDPELP